MVHNSSRVHLVAINESNRNQHIAGGTAQELQAEGFVSSEEIFRGSEQSQALHALPVILWLAESFTPCSELAKEEEANAVLYRNTFGTQPKRALGPLQNAFDLYLKNPANTNVVLWGNRLLALWEVNKRTTIQYNYCIRYS